MEKEIKATSCESEFSLPRVLGVRLYRPRSSSTSTVRSGDLCAAFWKGHSGQMVVIRLSTLPVCSGSHHWEGSWRSPAWGMSLTGHIFCAMTCASHRPACRDGFLGPTSTRSCHQLQSFQVGELFRVWQQGCRKTAELWRLIFLSHSPNTHSPGWPRTHVLLKMASDPPYYLPSPGISGVQHCTWFTECWGWNPGPHVC